jgi:hypothetical protein
MAAAPPDAAAADDADAGAEDFASGAADPEEWEPQAASSSAPDARAATDAPARSAVLGVQGMAGSPPGSGTGSLELNRTQVGVTRAPAVSSPGGRPGERDLSGAAPASVRLLPVPAVYALPANSQASPRASKE